MALADPRILLRMKQEGFAQSVRDTYSAICIFANPKTRKCRPGQRRLHKVAVLSLGAVNKAIKVLVDHGVIEYERGRGRGTSNYEITPEWWCDSGKPWPSCRSVHSKGRTKGRAGNQQESYSETPLPDAARASARRKGGKEQQGGEASQPAPGGLSEPRDSDQANRSASNADNSGSTVKPSTSTSGNPRPRSGPSPAEIEQRAQRRSERTAVIRAKRRNLLLTMGRWARFNLAGDDLLAALELFTRCELALHDWGARSVADIRAFDAMIARMRRDPLPRAVAIACWRAEGKATATAGRQDEDKPFNHGLAASIARGWGQPGRAGPAPGGPVQGPWYGRAAA
jgi:hypothetical protein